MEEIKKLVAEVYKNSKFELDYPHLDDTDLIYSMLLSFKWQTQCAARILNLCRPKESVGEVLKKIKWVCTSAYGLKWLRDIYPDHRVLRFLILLECWQSDISKNFRKRVDRNKISLEYMRLKTNSPVQSLERFLKLLKARKKTFHPNKEDGADLAQLALEEVVKYHAKSGRAVQAKPFFIPDLPSGFLELPTESKAIHEVIDGTTAAISVEAQRHLIPIIRGDMEKAAKAVHQVFKNHWEKWEAQKRTGDEVILEETKKDVGLKSFKDWLQQEQLGGEAKPDISARMFQVLKEAKKRWGSKAARAFLFMRQGKSEKEAAELAKIPYQSFRRYISKLKKEFSKKS